MGYLQRYNGMARDQRSKGERLCCTSSLGLDGLCTRAELRLRVFSIIPMSPNPPASPIFIYGAHSIDYSDIFPSEPQNQDMVEVSIGSDNQRTTAVGPMVC
jgi:hypothetical protein